MTDDDPAVENGSSPELRLGAGTGEDPDPFAGPDWSEPAGSITTASAASPESRGRKIKVSRRRRRMLRRRRRLGWVMIGFGGLVVLGGLWILVTGLMARSQLNQVRAEVHQLRKQVSAGDLAAARHTADEVAAHAHRAHELTTGPAWSLAAALPGGDPFDTVRGVTASIDTIGRKAVPTLITASRQLDPRALRNSDGSFDLARIAAVAPELTNASHVLTASTGSIAALPASSWLSAVDHGRSQVLAQLMGLDRAVRSADVAAQVAPAMLGASGPQTYFMAFQNDAEARGTGGLPGAFAIVQATNGKLKFSRFESDSTLSGVSADVNLGPDYQQLYGGADTTTNYANANLSPNFPYAAQIWASMWKNYSGQSVSGVLAVDPTALKYLLAVTGPATLPDKTQITSANVVALTQSTVYKKFPEPEQKQQRRNYLLQIAKAAATKVVDSKASATLLVRAAARAAGQRRLLVWSADPPTEAKLQQGSIAGAIPRTSAPYVGLSIVNDGGNKLDYYLHRSLTWQRTGCATQRQVTVMIKLTNDAPASGLSTYVTARSDRHSYPVKPGDSRLEVAYFGTAGGQLNSLTVDGKPGTATVGQEIGHPVFTVDLELPRATTGTIVLHLTEPAGTGSPIVLKQPLVHPLLVKVDDAKCG